MMAQWQWRNLFLRAAGFGALFCFNESYKLHLEKCSISTQNHTSIYYILLLVLTLNSWTDCWLVILPKASHFIEVYLKLAFCTELLCSIHFTGVRQAVHKELQSHLDASYQFY